MRIGGVLVVERDVELRDSLRELLREAGYASVGVSDLGLAQDVLRHSPCPLVVLVEHGDPRFHAEALVAAATASSGQDDQASQVGQHAYVLLSTHPVDAPRLRNPYTRHAVPVVALPRDLEILTSAVELAARRLRKRSRAPGNRRETGSVAYTEPGGVTQVVSLLPG